MDKDARLASIWQYHRDCPRSLCEQRYLIEHYGLEPAYPAWAAGIVVSRDGGIGYDPEVARELDGQARTNHPGAVR